MDEPFGALDAQTPGIMQRELLRLHETSGRTTLFVTHDIREAILLSDRVAVMSARTGTVKQMVVIDLPRPRWQSLQDQAPEFLRLERYPQRAARARHSGRGGERCRMRVRAASC